MKGNQKTMAQSFLDQLKSGGSSFLQGVQRQAARYTNKEFLRGVTAGIALTVLADGDFQDEEQDDVIEFVTTNPALAAFSATEKTALLQEYLQKAKNKMSQIELFGYISPLKSDATAAETLVQLVIVLANSDGDFADTEKKMVGRIARTLGLNAEDYI